MGGIIMNLLLFFADYNYIFAIIIPILTGIAGFMITKYNRHVKKKKINTILKLTKTDVDIKVPTRGGVVKPTGKATPLDTSFIAFDDALALHDVINIVQIVRHESPSFSTGEVIDFDKNNFCIGGPLANEAVAYLFRRYFASVKFGIPPKSINDNPQSYELLKDFIYEEASDDIGTISFNNSEFKFKRDIDGCIVLIRLVGEYAFGNKEHGTVHICFGNSVDTSRLAPKCYTTNLSQLHRRLKGVKGNYFVVLKCTDKGSIDFDSFKDYTAEVFRIE
jgi:hypothetical protein